MNKKIIKSKSKPFVVSAPKKKELEYDKDFFKWTKTQANLLKKGEIKNLDIDNLIEEIESLGKSDKRTLRSQMKRLLTHLLKNKYQPEGKGNSNSWDSSINEAISEIQYVIEDSPSLKRELIKIYTKSYEDARQSACGETRLDIKKFPEECPWKIEEILPFLKKGK